MKEQLFEDYLREARDEFVMEINSNEWNTKVRTAAESFLICFDQLRDRFLPASSKEVESEEKKAGCVWLNYIKQFPKMDEWFNSLSPVTRLWISQQIDIFAGKYPINEQTKEVSNNPLK